MNANFMRKLAPLFNAKVMGFLFNFYPPFLAAGIRIHSVSDDYSTIKVGLHSYGLNLNYVGTHFGGSLYAMADPFYMIMLIQKLGSGYIVWDKAARIEFKKPGVGTLRAEFHFSEAEFADIRQKADENPKYVFEKQVQIKNDHGEVVAVVDKVLYVKKKEKGVTPQLRKD